MGRILLNIHSQVDRVSTCCGVIGGTASFASWGYRLVEGVVCLGPRASLPQERSTMRADPSSALARTLSPVPRLMHDQEKMLL